MDTSTVAAGGWGRRRRDESGYVGEWRSEGVEMRHDEILDELQNGCNIYVCRA